MKKSFSIENGVYRFAMKTYEIMILNFLFIVTCLPVVTIGPAVTAAYATAFKLIDYDEGVLYKCYLNYFKLNFYKAFKIWIVMLSGLVLGWLNITMIGTFINKSVILYCLLMLLFSLIAISTIYVFPLTAKYENSVLNTFKNAFLISIQQLPSSLLCLFILCIGLVVIPLFSVRLFFLWLCCGFGISFYLTAKIFKNVFTKYQ